VSATYVCWHFTLGDFFVVYVGCFLSKCYVISLYFLGAAKPAAKTAKVSAGAKVAAKTKAAPKAAKTAAKPAVKKVKPATDKSKDPKKSKTTDVAKALKAKRKVSNVTLKVSRVGALVSSMMDAFNLTVLRTTVLLSLFLTLIKG